MTRALGDIETGRLAPDAYQGATGAGVRVAIIDSGVHPGHPHVGVVDAGVSFDAAGVAGLDTVDRLGHGTAIAAVIREKAPDATILPVKVFDRELRATVKALVAGIAWAVEARVDLINLSLGTANPAHQSRLGEVLVQAARAGIALVAAAEQDTTRWLPGSLPLAVGVTLDWECPREAANVQVWEEGAVRRIRASASGYPRPIPGVPPAQNLKGISFAVANVTGLLCLHLSRRRAQ